MKYKRLMSHVPHSTSKVTVPFVTRITPKSVTLRWTAPDRDKAWQGMMMDLTKSLSPTHKTTTHTITSTHGCRTLITHSQVIVDADESQHTCRLRNITQWVVTVNQWIDKDWTGPRGLPFPQSTYVWARTTENLDNKNTQRGLRLP